MKKNILKKAAAITLAGSMVLSMAACAGKANSQNGSGEPEAAADGKAVISFMVTQFQGTELKNDHSDEVIAKYEDYTNTHVEWRWEANDTYKEKLGLVLMDKDNMPMILTGSGELTANIVDAAKKGAFWDLREFLKDSESYPNLSQANENI